MNLKTLLSETNEEKQTRLAAKETLRVAKIASRKRFWFRVRLTVLLVPLMFFGCILGLVRLFPTSPTYMISNRHQSPITPEPPPVKPVAASKSNKPHGYQEGFSEKIYEKVTGKEIVHKKDGSTYIRRAPQPKAK